MFFIYSLILTIGFILMLPFFLLKREKYIAGFWQRLGYLPEFTQDSRSVLWIHCVSVGETNAARPLIEEIIKRFPSFRLIVSTTTRTGQELAKQIFKEQSAEVFYFPFDWKFSVRRALDHFKPNIVLIMETELWFNFIREAGKSGVVVAIVNGRLSEKSFQNYTKIKKMMARVLRRVDLALMQTQEDAKRLILLGIRPAKVKVTGNIKFDQKFVPNVLTDNLRDRFGLENDSPLIVAASTHAPEERWILEAFKQVYKNSIGNLPRLLIAPRHPERFDEIAQLVAATGFSWTRRSDDDYQNEELADVILLDSIGELRAVYPLAEIVFVGGSLIPHGGQSILEPAINGKAIVTGFYTANFAAAIKEFSSKNAVVQLPRLDEKKVVEKLTEVFTELLQDAQKREDLGTNAFAVMKKNSGATDKTIEQLYSFLQVHEVK